MHMTFTITYLSARIWRRCNALSLNRLQSHPFPPLNYLYSTCSEYSKRRIKTQNQGFDVPLGAYGHCDFEQRCSFAGRTLR